MPGNKRSSVAGHFLLSLDGNPCGLLKSVEGGGARAEVVEEALGSGYYPKKHIAGVIYDPFIVEVGLSMGKPFYDWIASTFSGKPSRKNGAVVAADFDNKAISQREFTNALIASVTFPAMDGSSKESAYLTVKFMPEVTRYEKATGKISGKLGKTKQKAWLASNFRLEIDGLECSRVSVIDSFIIKQGISETPKMREITGWRPHPSSSPIWKSLFRRARRKPGKTGMMISSSRATAARIRRRRAR